MIGTAHSRLAAPLLAAAMAAAAHGEESAAATPSPEPPAPSREATLLRTLEGRVLELSEASAEGELAVVVARVREARGERLVLLAPRSTLDEAGFELEVGDRLRALVFAEPGGERLYSQKVMNLSRRRLLRLRTLRHEPLWDLRGRWQSRADDSGSRRRRIQRGPPNRRRQPARRSPPRPSPPRRRM